jgi:hypothetical protein
MVESCLPQWGQNDGRGHYYAAEVFVSKPRELFAGEYLEQGQAGIQYDVSPDGLRFLTVKASEPATSATQINVELNWSVELKRRVPTGTK